MAGPSSFVQPGLEPFAAERAESDALEQSSKKKGVKFQTDDLVALLPDGGLDFGGSRRISKVDPEAEEPDRRPEEGWCAPFVCLSGEDKGFRRVVATSLGVFATYCLVYWLRSPWRAGTFPREKQVLGVEFKDALQISMTVAYFFGKTISAPILGGLGRKGRVPLLMICVLSCTTAWGGFALFPRAGETWEDGGRIAMIMLSAVPLAFFWATLFRYLEGRDATDVLSAWLSAAMIVGSGVAKSVGSALTDMGISEESMPVVAAGLAVPFLILAIIFMERLPPPSVEEQERKGARLRLSAEGQKLFVKEYWVGFVPLAIVDISLTGLRDFRDAFVADMWKELNDGNDMPSWLFTFTEVFVAVFVLLAMAGVSLVKDNERGFKLILSYCILGAVLLGAVQLLATHWLWKSQAGQAVWVIVSGLGIFLAYVPTSALLYDRLIAALGVRATSVFIMSITSALGYAGSVGLLLFRNYNDSVKTMNKHEFFRDSSMVGSCTLILALVWAWLYFSYLFKRYRADPSLRPEF
eukprot:Hpha_TRINITY_DN15544_c1_g1::TRINITY_DN15544_c1_g1_i1::g.108131::m.108131